MEGTDMRKILALVTMAAALAACESAPSPDGYATSELKIKPVTMKVTPSPAPVLYAGQSQQFVATLGGQPASATWTLSYGLGTISADGLYQAPVDQSWRATVTITARTAQAVVTFDQQVGPAPVDGGDDADTAP
jgi:predicted component of type VI protein secretion system